MLRVSFFAMLCLENLRRDKRRPRPLFWNLPESAGHDLDVNAAGIELRKEARNLALVQQRIAANKGKV
jgi:hypothetical protein